VSKDVPQTVKGPPANNSAIMLGDDPDVAAKYAAVVAAASGD
jgi:hypothetical protein